jgi:hypothetical protein
MSDRLDTSWAVPPTAPPCAESTIPHSAPRVCPAAVSPPVGPFLLAASTGLRQSEIFGLKWDDIDFERGTMSVIRSIVYGVVGPCKTESSQKPVPMHPTLADALMQWSKRCTYFKPEDWVFASKRYRGRRPYWARRSCANTYVPWRNESEFKSDLDGIRSGTMPNPRLCRIEVLKRSGKLRESCGSCVRATRLHAA